MVEILFGGGDFYARAIYTIPQKSNGGQECLDGGKTDHGWSSRTPSLPFLTKKKHTQRRFRIPLPDPPGPVSIGNYAVQVRGIRLKGCTPPRNQLREHPFCDT